MMQIDFHAHILPGVDHGCPSAEVAQQQLQYAKQSRFHTVVSTSHFYPHLHSVEAFLERRQKGYEELQAVWQEGMPAVRLGAEVLLCPSLEQMPQIDSLCIEGTDGVILLELPFQGPYERIWETVYRLQKMGLYPVMAHLDRYPESEWQEAMALGVDIQMNVDTMPPPLARRRWKKTVAECSVCALGSDIHGADARAYHFFDKAVQALGESETERVMTRSAQLLKLI